MKKRGNLLKNLKHHQKYYSVAGISNFGLVNNKCYGICSPCVKKIVMEFHKVL